MVNPFEEINWRPDRSGVRKFGKLLVIVGVAVAGLAFAGTRLLADAPPALAVFSWLFASFGLLGAVSFLFPAIGKPIYVVWHFVGACVGIVMVNLMLALFFYGFFSPIALFMRRIVGRDPLSLKPSGTGSSWRRHEPPTSLARYYKQY